MYFDVFLPYFAIRLQMRCNVASTNGSKFIARRLLWTKTKQKRNVRYASCNGFFQTEIHFYVDWIKRVHDCPVSMMCAACSALLCSSVCGALLYCSLLCFAASCNNTEATAASRETEKESERHIRMAQQYSTCSVVLLHASAKLLYTVQARARSIW